MRAEGNMRLTDQDSVRGCHKISGSFVISNAMCDRY